MTEDPTAASIVFDIHLKHPFSVIEDNKGPLYEAWGDAMLTLYEFPQLSLAATDVRLYYARDLSDSQHVRIFMHAYKRDSYLMNDLIRYIQRPENPTNQILSPLLTQPLHKAKISLASPMLMPIHFPEWDWGQKPYLPRWHLFEYLTVKFAESRAEQEEDEARGIMTALWAVLESGRHYETNQDLQSVVVRHVDQVWLQPHESNRGKRVQVACIEWASMDQRKNYLNELHSRRAMRMFSNLSSEQAMDLLGECTWEDDWDRMIRSQHALDYHSEFFEAKEVKQRKKDVSGLKKNKSACNMS